TAGAGPRGGSLAPGRSSAPRRAGRSAVGPGAGGGTRPARARTVPGGRGAGLGGPGGSPPGGRGWGRGLPAEAAGLAAAVERGGDDGTGDPGKGFGTVGPG